MPRYRKKSGHGQLRLFPYHDEGTLREFLERLSGKPVNLALTDNVSSMLSIRQKGQGVTVRLQKIFLYAGPDVLVEIGTLIRHGRGKRDRLRWFIEENSRLMVSRAETMQTIRTRGRHHDLKALFDRLNRDYFDGRIRSVITWAPGRNLRSARKRTLGSYIRTTDTIRINPVLDRKSIPRYVIEFIIYHEMLHADMGVTVTKGRRIVHSVEFKRRERLFHDYERVIEWERKPL